MSADKLEQATDPLLLQCCYSEIWSDTLKMRSSSKRRLFLKGGKKLRCVCVKVSGKENGNMGTFFQNLTMETKGDDLWFTQALLVSVCEKQLITGTSILIVPYSLCHFSPTFSVHEQRNPTLKMVAMCQLQALPLEQSFCLKSYSTCFVYYHGTLISRQRFLWIWNDDMASNCYLSLPSPSPEEYKVNLNKAASLKLNQKKKPLQLVLVSHECKIGRLLLQKFKQKLAFWIVCI